MKNKGSRYFFLMMAFLALWPMCLKAQETINEKNTPQSFKAQARALDAVTLLAGGTKIRLWGIEIPNNVPVALQLKGRAHTDDLLGTQPVQCNLKAHEAGLVIAQCRTESGTDIAQSLIKNGYGTADRVLVYNSASESDYLNAEKEAQNNQLGLWGFERALSDGVQTSKIDQTNIMVIFGFILFLCIITAFTFLSIIIMRGFQKVIDAQNQNVEMMSRERKVKDKERQIVATMIDSELKANKAKIEAYLVVYEEMLKALKDPERPPKYKKSGDIVQKQPALDRSVFDRNTDKLDTFDRDLASRLVHFYARIKSKPEYENLEPDTSITSAIAMLEKAVDNAQRLNKIAQDLIADFSGNAALRD